MLWEGTKLRNRHIFESERPGAGGRLLCGGHENPGRKKTHEDAGGKQNASSAWEKSQEKSRL